MTKPRVLQVISGGETGGAETTFVDITLALHRAGLEQKVVVRENRRIWTQRLFDAGLDVYEAPFKKWFDFKTKPLMRQVIKEFQPHIVQTWMNRASAMCPKWDKSLPPFLQAARLGGYYDIKNYKNCTELIAIAPDIKRYLIEKGWPEEKVKVLWNYALIEEPKTVVNRSTYGTPDDAPLFLALGRLHVNKAYDILLDAMAKVPTAHLWIAGEGGEREALEAQIKRLGLQGRVKLLGWRNDRAELLQATDFVIFPSRHEPFGTVTIQAWAYEKPLVVSAADGPKSCATGGYDCLMVPINDVDRLADAMQRMIDDTDLQKTLVENGRKTFAERFSEAAVVKAYLKFYNDLSRKLPSQ